MIRRAPLTVRTSPPRTLFLGSFPPRECGIATFTNDVIESFDAVFATRSDVISIEEPGAAPRAYPPRVIASLHQNDRASYREIARIVDAHPAEILAVQHEYGLFGGDEGAWFADLLESVAKPVVVSLHTVLPDPSPAHRALAREICARAAAVVVLSQTGKDILGDVYAIDPDKVFVIHHGVPDVPFRSTRDAKRTFGIEDRLVISTFGLISRGKGLEYGIDAMRAVADRHPSALYLILGQTHPNVRRAEGESYRDDLTARIAARGLEGNVRLVDRYLDFDELLRYLGASDIYMTPYLNPVQIVSGTLAYAVGLGKAIVSTPYLYAEELLASGRGVLAPFRDAPALAAALVRLLDDPWLRRATERRAYRFGRQMTWAHVAREYGHVFDEAIGSLRRPLSLVRPA